MNNSTVYVLGHRNPDTDAIVSAMSYAALRNALGDREYRAGRLGIVSDETRMVLDRFGFEAPELIKDIRTQIRDLDYDTPPCLDKGATVSRAWAMLQQNKSISAIPVVNEDGTLYSMLTAGDIADYNMQSCEDPFLRSVPLFNLLGAIEGKVLNSAGALTDVISGEVIIALPLSRETMRTTDPNSVLICGNQPDVIERALDLGVSCIIVCQAEVPAELCERESSTCIISTPMSARRAARMVYLGAPIYNICPQQEIVSFHLGDYLDDVRNTLMQSRFRSYPILDERNVVVGALSRYHVLHPKKKRVVLVDHNELAQSVPGLEQAEIVAIIDHHRLADIQTASPVLMRNEPVGSTTTIVAGMFQTSGLMPSPKLAGLMAAAILSDTVIFKSPTCTQRDREMAARMARIANISLEELGREIFSSSYGENKTAEEMLMADFKQFHIAGHSIAVSQITCVDSEKMLERRQEFMDCLEQLRSKNDYELCVLMLTDILREGSQILYAGNAEAVHQAFNVAGDANCFFLPGVISRKKQVIPMLTTIWG